MGSGDEDDDDDNDMEINDKHDDFDDDDDAFDDDKLTEESYRTTFDPDPEDLNIAAEDVAEEEF